MAETMKAGEELDKAIAAMLFDEKYWLAHTFPLPYSTDYNAAFAVVDRMRELGWRCKIETFMDCEPLVTFNHDDGAQSRQAVNESGETIPECICLAALAALKRGTNPTDHSEGK
jgi:hypothetical protein